VACAGGTPAAETGAHEETDFVRIEVEAALNRAIAVVAVYKIQVRIFLILPPDAGSQIRDSPYEFT
jgi:hypothetical protein